MLRTQFPRLSRHRLTLSGAGAVVPVLAVLLALAGVWRWPVALGVAGIAVVVSLQVATLLYLRHLRGAVHGVHAALEEHEEFESHLRPLTRQLATAARQDRFEVVIALDQLRTQNRRRFKRVNLRLKRHHDDFAQIEALLDLRSLLQPSMPMPESRGWAAPPTTLRALVSAVLETAPSLVVECGSGASSIWLGHALRRLGAGRCVALEHVEEFASETRAEVARHGLQDVVEVRLAPIARTEVDSTMHPWYAVDHLADLHDIGVVFVDGPPGDLAPLARYPAVPLLKDRCQPNALFLLDDASRPEEGAVIDRWVSEHDLRSVQHSARKKGWHLLALPSA